MKTKYLTSLAMAALLLAACSDEQELASIPSGEGILRATVEGASPATRAGFDSEGAFYWTRGDQLGVTTASNGNSFSALTLSEASIGQTTGTFDGSLGSEELGSYAVYPHNDSYSLNGTTLTYNFPASYTYTQVDADYFTETQGEGNSFNPAMWGSIRNGSTQLKHLGGVFCIKIESMPLADGKLTLTADKAITGTFTADLNGETPVLTSTETVAENNTVTIDFSGATQDASGVFYVPVPTGTYNVRIKVTDDSNTTEHINAAVGTSVVNRCDLKQITLTESSIDAKPADDLSAAATDLGTYDNVTVSEQVSSTQSIEIPSTTGGAEVTKTLSLQDVASGASLTITDGAGSTTSNSVGNLVFSIPTNETEEYEPLDLTVTMPNTTVTLAGNGGKATYGEVTASTAENTLIVSAGVSINKLTVTKGNIRLQGDAAISEIVNSKESDAKLYIYVEGNEYKIPEGLGEDIVVVDASVADLKAVASNGGEYTLQSDITLTEPLVVAGEMTLDLNGHALKASEAGLTKVLNTSDAVVLVRRGAKLTINDSSNGQGSIDYNGAETVSVAVKVIDSNDESDTNIQNQPAELIVNGGTLRGYWYGISGNGTRHNTSITVNGGTIRGSLGTGIYHPQDGMLTITDGVVTGLNAAVELRSGTLNVSGGTFGSTATEFEATSNGSGTTISGAAIAISQHTTNKAINVTISGGILNGIYALYEEDLQDESVTQITVSAGSNAVFNGKVYSENCAEFISGGTFNDPSALAYLSETGNVTINIGEDLTLTESMVIRQGSAVIDLNQHYLTATAAAVVEGTTHVNQSVAIYVDTDAEVTVKNGKIGESTIRLFYGIFGKGNAKVNLENVEFSEMLSYAYNGAGSLLNADNCTFHGWISGWGNGTATFDGCTFTIGKAWYPAAICYGNTTFTSCKFFKNENDADVLGAQGANDENGYYNYSYVVAIANPATTIDFNACSFIDESGAETTITVDNHPYHACGDWGDGKLPEVSQIQVDGQDVTTQCHGFTESSTEGGETTEGTTEE